MTTSTIIGPGMLPVITKALADLQTASAELELARRAGLFAGTQGTQLSDLVTKVADAQQQLLAIKQVYFPGQ